ncbi:MAG TPA: T9SS type A sorting domain-containing protein [Chitinophagaceae bacterium]
MKTKLTRITSAPGNFVTITSACAILLSTVHAQQDLSQGPITLTYKNFITPAQAKYFYQGADAAGVAIPAHGANKVWDYSKLVKNNANNDSRSYVPASYPAYPNALRQFDNFFALAGIPIAQTNMESNDENSYHGLGTHFERQAFPLESITGNANDSLIINRQNVHELHQVWEKYPVTYLSSYMSHSISVTNFQLSIAAFGLDHVPGQFVQHTFDKREVVGWGKVRIPASSGPGQFIRALLQKLNVLKIDSVYLAGSPAPPELLAAFGVTQGETDNSYYQYRFYRRGIDAYLINFFMDSKFKTITGLNYDAKYADRNDDNMIAASSPSEDDLTINEITIKAFPNPSRNEFTINLSGKSAVQASVLVFDLSGKQVQKFENVSTGELKFGKELRPGIYMVQVIQNNRKKTFKLVKTE